MGDVLLEVGHIVKPHGLRGEVVVELTTNRLERVAPGSKLVAPSKVLEVRHARAFDSTGGGRWIVAFDGVETRDGAEALRGALLRAEPLEDPDAWWAHELIGSAVTGRGGEALGTVVAVEANPASDLLVLDGGALIPLCFVVERAPGSVVVDPPAGLLELP